MTTAYPLAWPDGWPRYPQPGSQPSGRGTFMRGRFDTGGRYSWTFAEARDGLAAELKRFGAANIVVSSNFPLSDKGVVVEGRRRPDDQGVAVYFTRRHKPYVMAYDEWREIESNFRSLALAIEALRQLERHGGGKMLERAFEGFLAIAAPKAPHEIIGVQPDASPAEIRAAWRDRAAACHPDIGGSHAAMSELNAARDAMLKGRS